MPDYRQIIELARLYLAVAPGYCLRARNLAWLPAVLVFCVLAGCAELDIRKNIPWMDKDEKYGEPTKVVVMWADAMLNQTERKGVRGFGGRLYFYAKNPNKPIKVKGTLVIYAFDESTRSPDSVVPDKKFVFTPDQLEKHYSKNDVGASYSIWLPWDEIGGFKKEVSLIARFTSEKGALVISDQTMQDLPGLPSPEQAAEAKAKAKSVALPVAAPPVVPAAMLNGTPQFPGAQMSYEQPVGATTAAAQNTARAVALDAGAPGLLPRNTTTIALPMNQLMAMQPNGNGNGQQQMPGAQMGTAAANMPAQLPQRGANLIPGANLPQGSMPQPAMMQPAMIPTAPVNGANAAAATNQDPGKQVTPGPLGPVTTNWGVLPNSGFPAVPPHSFGGQGLPTNLPNAGGTAIQNNLGFPRSTGARAPVGWNASAPWNAPSNPAGLTEGSGAFASNPMNGTAGMPVGAMQQPPPSMQQPAGAMPMQTAGQNN